VARERGVPVIVLKRPVLPGVEREFGSVPQLLDTLSLSYLS
jgi:precorrin-6A/cobalt-precorrin-6A reductase